MKFENKKLWNGDANGKKKVYIHASRPIRREALGLRNPWNALPADQSFLQCVEKFPRCPGSVLRQPTICRANCEEDAMLKNAEK